MREAENLFLRIGHGKPEMIKRPADPVVDRELKRIINGIHLERIRKGQGYPV